ncbi:MAG: hypothetical protein VKJ46_11030 [Leptolyngbyaceae bacterium]|nr:hypothetical protein [Leptolyngbyaceae bacterium]
MTISNPRVGAVPFCPQSVGLSPDVAFSELQPRQDAWQHSVLYNLDTIFLDFPGVKP